MTALTADEYAAITAMDLHALDLTHPRTLQALSGQVGISDLGKCQEQTRLLIAEHQPTDSPSTWAAFVGTSLHDKWTAARTAGNPRLMHSVKVELRLPNGLVVPGTVDEVDPDEPSVTDLKGLALDTPIPVPTGWTTMGDLRVGDTVFGSDGRPCRVVGKSAVKNIGTYIVKFTDGATVVCDREHYWWVLAGQHTVAEQVTGVEAMRDNLTTQGQVNYRVPVAAALDLPDACLPVDPYVLGYWLGNGATRDSLVTCHADDADEIFQLIGESEPVGQKRHQVGNAESRYIGMSAPVRDSATGQWHANASLRSRLRALGVFGDKHIPAQYLRASRAQREALLQGLMDSDGTWNRARSRAVFTTTSKALAEGFLELAATLGLKPCENWYQARGFGLTVSACAIEFTPLGVTPFRLRRKADLVNVTDGQAVRARVRYVKSIEPGPDVPTACIAVDSPNHTYLCGRDMIPTHNSKDGLAVVRRQGADRQQRWQRHGYYAALVQAGVLPPEGIVRNVFLDRSGKDDRPHVEQEPYDPSVLDEMAAWLDEVVDAHKAGHEALKEKPRTWCRSYCQWYSACRLAEVDAPLLFDAALAEKVDGYYAADRDEKEAKQRKEELREFVEGVTGFTRTARIQSTWVNKGSSGGWRVEVSAP